MMLSPGAIGAVSEILDAGDFYRESHAKIYRAALDALRAGRAGRRDHARRRARASAASSRRSAGEPRIHELAALVPAAANAGPLRAHRPRDGDAARADPRRAARSRGSAWSAPGETHGARRPRRADHLRPLAAARLDRVQPHRGAAEGELRADHRAVRGGRRRHRRPVRLPRPRPADVGLPAGQPDHRRGAAEHGEVGVRRSASPRTSPSGTSARSRCSRSRCRRRRSRSA